MVNHAWYGRHKRDIFSGLRLALWSIPIVWNDVGVQKALRAAPMPGATGILRDLWRLVFGTRLLAISIGCLAGSTSLALSLALQVHATLMARRNATICAAPLLSAPLTAWRLRWLNRALAEAAALGEPAARHSWCADPFLLPPGAATGAPLPTDSAAAAHRIARAFFRPSPQAVPLSPRFRCWMLPGSPRPRQTARPSWRCSVSPPAR